jgi:2'-5' RNA ligase
MRRLFFGLEIPVQIKDRLLKVRAEVSGAKWQSVEQMHVILLFPGDVEAMENRDRFIFQFPYCS